MRETKIGWTHSTVNGSSGCDGCELWNDATRNCYAGNLHEGRLAKSLPSLYAPNFGDVRMIAGRFTRAAAWGFPSEEEFADKPWFAGKPRHIFVGDMGDFLSDAVTDDFLESELLASIVSTNGRRHVWQLLTKRPQRLATLSEKWGGLPDNVIAMTTVTNQRTANVRIPSLLRVKCKVKGLSCEPLLSLVDLKLSGGIHWVIVGGESGNGARIMQPEWALAVRDQCAAARVAFFFKQWGGVRKEVTGRILDGKTYDELPRINGPTAG